MSDLAGFDELDRRIIEKISTSNEGSFRQIAKDLGVHPTPLIQRVKNLEKKGVIMGSRAKINYMKLGFDYMGIVQIYVEGDAEKVHGEILKMPQVVSSFFVTGDCDIVAWVACKDREEFSDTVKHLMSIAGVKKTSTSVVLDMVKDPFEFVPKIV